MKKLRTILLVAMSILSIPCYNGIYAITTGNKVGVGFPESFHDLLVLLYVASPVMISSALAMFLASFISFTELPGGKIIINNNTLFSSLFLPESKDKSTETELDFCACYWNTCWIITVLAMISSLLFLLGVAILSGAQTTLSTEENFSKYSPWWLVGAVVLAALWFARKWLMQIKKSTWVTLACTIALGLLGTIFVTCAIEGQMLQLFKVISIVIAGVIATSGVITGIFLLLTKTFIGTLLQALKDKTCIKIIVPSTSQETQA